MNEIINFGEKKKVKVIMLKGEKGDKGDSGSVGDYSELINKPSINSVEIDGAMTSEDFGLATAGDVEQLQNSIEEHVTIAENNLGMIEPSDVAMFNHSVGTYLVFNGYFYKAITNISAGDTLSDDATTGNIVSTKIASELTSINTNKQDKTDNNLLTQDKTVVGAINSVYTELDGTQLDVQALQSGKVTDLGQIVVPNSETTISNALANAFGQVYSLMTDGKQASLFMEWVSHNAYMINSFKVSGLVIFEATTSNAQYYGYYNSSNQSVIVNEVQTKIKTLFGQYTTITGYDSRNNVFTVPTDGYIICSTPTAVTNQIIVREYASASALVVARPNGTYGGFASLFVPKGLKVYCTNATADSTAIFFPLI